MNQNKIVDLGTWRVGDRYPFPFFKLFKKTYDVVSGLFIEAEIDIASELTDVKFCARHESNMADIDDHTEDDIYSSISTDAGGVCHYEWGVSDLVKSGMYYILLEIERTDGRKYHSAKTYSFHVEHKMNVGGIITNL